MSMQLLESKVDEPIHRLIASSVEELTMVCVLSLSIIIVILHSYLQADIPVLLADYKRLAELNYKLKAIILENMAAQ